MTITKTPAAAQLARVAETQRAQGPASTAATATVAAPIAAPIAAQTADADRGRDAVKRGVVAEGAAHPASAPGATSPLQMLIAQKGAPSTLPRAIPGTVDAGSHPHDAWSSSVHVRFHQHGRGQTSGKPFHEVFGDAVRTAQAAPAATEVPASLLAFMKSQPPPAGSTVHISVESFEGRDLYSYLALAPVDAHGRIDVDLQLFSTEGRVVGTLAGLDKDDL